MKLVNFRRLKIGRRSRTRERKRNHHFNFKLKIKFTFLDLKLAETALLKLSSGDRETIRPFGASETDLGDRETIWPCGASEQNLGDRNAVPGHQGGAVVPDVKTAHKVIRPETH